MRGAHRKVTPLFVYAPLFDNTMWYIPKKIQIIRIITPYFVILHSKNNNG